MQTFDYSRLWGKLKAENITQVKLSKVIGIAPNTLGLKLKGKVPFRQNEISAISDILGISPTEIGDYFFTQKVEESQQMR